MTMRAAALPDPYSGSARSLEGAAAAFRRLSPDQWRKRDRIVVSQERQLHHRMRKNVAGPERGAARAVASGRFDLDLDPWVDALRALPLAPATEDDILAWLDGPLRRFFPFQKCLVAYGGLSGGVIQMRSTMLSLGHSAEYL